MPPNKNENYKNVGVIIPRYRTISGMREQTSTHLLAVCDILPKSRARTGTPVGSSVLLLLWVVLF